MEKKIKVLVKAYMVKYAENKMPMRTMVGTVKRETAKAYLVSLHGQPEPTSTCLHCNRKLTHPVSVLYGIGPVCGQHWHINPFDSQEELEAAMDELKEKMAAITWEGWVPKSQIIKWEELEPVEQPESVQRFRKYEVIFFHDGKQYRTETNEEKLQTIMEKADHVLSVVELKEEAAV